jgi:hypothetical protein
MWNFFYRIPLTALILLWLAYAFLGWYLAANHIIWLVGAFVAAMVLAVARKGISWLERLVEFGSKILILILFLSIPIALLATCPLLFSLFIIPLATTLLADLEMRFSGFTKLDSFWMLTVLAILGLIVGEVIDILFFASSRY